jgi:hypothetical protein
LSASAGHQHSDNVVLSKALIESRERSIRNSHRTWCGKAVAANDLWLLEPAAGDGIRACRRRDLVRAILAAALDPPVNDARPPASRAYGN